MKAHLLILFAALTASGATDYYVSTDGDDDLNNGLSTNAPFATITHAYGEASAGSTIYVLPGTYTDYTSTWGLHLGSSGTAGNPITLKSTVLLGATIDGENASDRNQGIFLDGSYNTIDGFVITRGPKGGIHIEGNHNIIKNCEIHHNGNPANASENGFDGAHTNPDTDSNVFLNNYIHDNGRGLNNLDHGMYLCGISELIANNIVVHNANAGIQISGTTEVIDMVVINNVSAFNGTSGIVVTLALDGVDIRNNIVVFNGTRGYNSWAATGSGVVLDWNCVYGNPTEDFNFTGGSSTYTYVLTNSVLSDPLLTDTNLATFDCHIPTNSPCSKVGTNLYATLTTDKAGAARPSSGRWDLGVYEAQLSGGATNAATMRFGTTRISVLRGR